MIVQLVYISTPIGKKIDEIENFISSARERNAKKGISSIMLITECAYLHCIEGERAAVSELYNKICNDTRHSHCTILRFNELPKREFDDFHATVYRLSSFDTLGVNTVCPVSIIDLHTISAARAMTLLRRTAAHYRADNK